MKNFNNSNSRMKEDVPVVNKDFKFVPSNINIVSMIGSDSRLWVRTAGNITHDIAWFIAGEPCYITTYHKKKEFYILENAYKNCIREEKLKRILK